MQKLLKAILFSVSVLALGMGASLPAQAGDKATADEAVAMVKKAVDYLKKNGKERALAEFSNPKGQFIDRDLYIFAFSTNGDGIELANGSNPKMVGKNLLELKDTDGKYFVKHILELANNKSGQGWIEYQWPNPTTKAIDGKKSYIQKIDDILIGCGVYK
ncbi:MAG: cache domain-containing protein [Pseudomonadota bacterium]